MRLIKWLLGLSIYFVCVVSVRCVYFHLSEDEKRCFIEDIPEETILVGKYKVEVFDPAENQFVPAVTGFGTHVEVSDPDDQIILSRTYAMQGRFTFTAQQSGEHRVCLNSSTWSRGAEMRVHLTLLDGESAVDLSAIKQAEQLTDLQLRVRALLEHVDSIAREQNYGRAREEDFRELSASTYERVFIWSMVQTSLLLLVGFWQMRHLCKFFEAKKLV